MEELLIVVVQLLVEVLAQALFFFPLEIFAEQGEASDAPGGCGWFFISCMIGAALGGLSIYVAPHLVLPHPALRLVNVCISPLAVGGMAYWLAQGRKEVGHKIEPSHVFWLGLAFSLCFTLIRLAFGSR